MSAQVIESVRWTVSRGEAEFGIGRDTLSKRLHTLGEQPGDDGRYSTRQICSAVFGDTAAEKARLAREQADRVAMDNAERRRELIAVADAQRIAGRYVFAARQRILALALSDEEKNAILAELRRLAEEDFTRLPDAAE